MGAAAVAGLDAPVRFGWIHCGPVYLWVVPPLLVTGLVVALWPVGAAGLVGVVLFLAVYAAVVPRRAFWSGGIPRTLDGTTLTLRRPFGRCWTLDLRGVTVATLCGSRTRGAGLSARWLLLGHADGAVVNKKDLQRLQVPAAELDALAERIDRVVVVQLDGPRSFEVLGPVGTLISGNGADLSAGFRSELARIRSLDRPHGSQRSGRRWIR